MYLVRCEDNYKPFNNLIYNEQQLACKEAKRLATYYDLNFYVCKIVDIAIYKPLIYGEPVV